MHIHFIIHEYFEAPGAYEIWAQKHAYTMSYTRLYAGDRLPDQADHLDLLIVMGGPQSPATSRTECEHFDAKAEQGFIGKAIGAGKAVIGVCLGSQLIGESLGASYESSPYKEIGKFSITLTAEGERHPLFSHFGPTLQVGHWHSDMPGLTSQSQLIAFSDGCPRQIIAYTELVYGFQCHMELTTEVVKLLIANDDIESLAHHRFVESPSALLAHDYQVMNQHLFTFLDKLVRRYQRGTFDLNRENECHLQGQGTQQIGVE